MKKRVFALICQLYFVQLISAQTTIKGKLIDTVNYTSLAYSTVMLIQQTDSVIAAYTRTNAEGDFTLKNITRGRYRLLITRPSFADYEDIIMVEETPLLDVGSISMISKANLLKEVIIKEKSNAIRIRGDTTEYLVDSFLTNKNSNVEDLLKKLPGLQVDKDGKITAQGQSVKKVLVDGEEFFGNDPTMATKNIRAEDVEKVQVFDKQSEQAAFTGIDDGEKEKTINLQLKEDAKKGYFGKAGAAAGTDSRYEAEAMVNAFSSKRKISGYSLSNNTNKMNLDWDDQSKFGGSSGFEFDEINGYYYMEGGGNYDNQEVGVPRTTFSGLFYSDKLKNETHNYNVSITQRNVIANGFNRNYTKYILPDTLYYNSDNTEVLNNRNRLGANIKYEWAVDSFTTIKLVTGYSQQESKDITTTTSENRNENNALVTQNLRRNEVQATNKNLDVKLTFMRKFRKQGRSFMLSTELGQVDRISENLLTSNLNFYDSLAQLINTNVLDQKQNNTNNLLRYSISTTYTEPLITNVYLVTDYAFNQTTNDNRRDVNAKQNNEYNLFVDSLSNDLNYVSTVHRGGIAFRYTKNKWNASVGGKVSTTLLEQYNREVDTGFTQTFVNVFPSANVSYKLKNTSNLSLRYNGNTTQPTISQIQPIQDINNPLNISLGNPNLRQSFNNRLNFSYNNYKPISGQGMYLSVNGSYTADAFVNSETIDGFGRRTSQTVNADGVMSAGMYSSFYRDFKKLKTSAGVNFSPSVRRNINYINGLQNINLSSELEFGANADYRVDEILELGTRADWSYNTNSSSLRPNAVTNFWINTYNVYTTIKLKNAIEISSNCAINTRQRTQDFDRDLNTVIWDASVSKRFFKSRSLALSVEAFDLLNQNIGFMRTNNSNFVNENTYSILQRYILVRLLWNFTKGRVEVDEF